MKGLVFDNQYPDQPRIPGDFILKYIFQINVNRSKWIDLSVIFSMIFIYRSLFFLMIKINEDVLPWIRGNIARKRMQNKAPSSTFGKTPSLRGYVVDPELGSNEG